MSSSKGWAFITGSSRGIGQQLALGLAKMGYSIALHGRTKSALKNSSSILESLGVEYKLFEGELSKKSHVDHLCKAIDEEIGLPELIWNNAGVQNSWKNATEFTLDEWEDIFQINFFSAVAITDFFLPPMKKRGSGEIFYTSTGIEKIPQMLPYACSKAALRTYVSDLVPELGGGVNIYSCDPGWCRTDLGGDQADHPVESVLPGALAPLIDRSIASGSYYRAHDYSDIKLI